uniref:Uncharacterized protein n=1 Tax=Anguilla anguilla TaxID=7936 RepID=A0A0E9T4Q6_ANGAN
MCIQMRFGPESFHLLWAADPFLPLCPQLALHQLQLPPLVLQL